MKSRMTNKNEVKKNVEFFSVPGVFQIWVILVFLISIHTQPGTIAPQHVDPLGIGEEALMVDLTDGGASVCQNT